MLKNKRLNIAKNSKWFAAASFVIIFVGIIIMSVLGLNRALEFTGGRILDIGIDPAVETNYDEYKAVIKNIFRNNNQKIYSIQSYGSTSRGGIVVKYQNPKNISSEQIEQKASLIETEILTQLNANNPELAKVNANESLGKSVRNISVVLSGIGIVIAAILLCVYIGVRLGVWASVCAAFAIAHDTLMLLALTAIFRLPISTMFLIAVAATAAYSAINSILLFARVRENTLKEINQNSSNDELVEMTIKQTKMRTLIISFSAMAIATMLIILGKNAALELVLPVIFGIAAVIYSSIHLTGALFAAITKKRGFKFCKKTKIKTVSKIEN